MTLDDGVAPLPAFGGGGVGEDEDEGEEDAGGILEEDFFGRPRYCI